MLYNQEKINQFIETVKEESQYFGQYLINKIKGVGNTVAHKTAQTLKELEILFRKEILGDPTADRLIATREAINQAYTAQRLNKSIDYDKLASKITYYAQKELLQSDYGKRNAFDSETWTKLWQEQNRRIVNLLKQGKWREAHDYLLRTNPVYSLGYYALKGLDFGLTTLSKALAFYHLRFLEGRKDLDPRPNEALLPWLSRLPTIQDAVFEKSLEKAKQIEPQHPTLAKTLKIGGFIAGLGLDMLAVGALTGGFGEIGKMGSYRNYLNTLARTENETLIKNTLLNMFKNAEKFSPELITKEIVEGVKLAKTPKDVEIALSPIFEKLWGVSTPKTLHPNLLSETLDRIWEISSEWRKAETPKNLEYLKGILKDEKYGLMRFLEEKDLDYLALALMKSKTLSDFRFEVIRTLTRKIVLQKGFNISDVVFTDEEIEYLRSLLRDTQRQISQISKEVAEKRKEIYPAFKKILERLGEVPDEEFDQTLQEMYRLLKKQKVDREISEAIRERFTSLEPLIKKMIRYTVVNPILMPYQKLNGITALRKILMGEVPYKSELKVLTAIFPGSLIGDLMAMAPELKLTSKIVRELFGLPRAVLASWDFSMPLRQGIVLFGTREWWRAFWEQFKAVPGLLTKRGREREEFVEEILNQIVNKPSYPLAELAGLEITTPGSLVRGEEYFMSKLAGKIPGVKFSEDVASIFLNKLRMDTFDYMIKEMTILGYDMTDMKNLKAVADYINIATGRGDLKKLGSAASFLNKVLFAPKLIASRIQFMTRLLNPYYYKNTPKYIVANHWRDALKLAALIWTVAGLAEMAGAEVEKNPNSADFMKIKIGPTRIDLGGGFLQYLVLFSRLLTGRYKSSTTGKEYILNETDPEGFRKFGALTRAEILLNFIKNKTNPVVSFVWDLLEGSAFGGKPFNITAEIAEKFIPMGIQDTIDLITQNPDYIPLSVLGLLGAGIQTYEGKKEKELREKIEQTYGLSTEEARRVLELYRTFYGLEK